MVSYQKTLDTNTTKLSSSTGLSARMGGCGGVRGELRQMSSSAQVFHRDQLSQYQTIAEKFQNRPFQTI